MSDDITCPNCTSSELTLIEKYEEEDTIKYIYLCRKCKKTFTVVIGVAS